ncbi:hypothetical protein ACFWMU_26955 [Streptomyces sp. NPDC058357]|uniref:hypothetical protein n=1 Tax=unclassified Streptomyces TaxID=2593676 RepID=UPI0036646586
MGAARSDPDVLLFMERAGLDEPEVTDGLRAGWTHPHRETSSPGNRRPRATAAG